MSDLSADERARYARHIMLPDVGLEGQLKLKQSSVCVIGAGGLGSPALLYLAAAGVGRIGIIDDDLVDATNLQRQIVHGTPDVGSPKVESAKMRLEEVNPEVEVEVHEVRLNISNALEILDGYDVILDGTDNIPTRYLVSDACEILGIPWVYGSIFRFEGQVTLFNHQGGPNYRDLFPDPPPPDAVPSCAEAGVLGVLPGVVGSIQATEALKVMLGIGETLSGRLLVYDAKGMEFRTLKVDEYPKRDPVTELVELDAYCEVPTSVGIEGAPVDGAAGEEMFGIGGAGNISPDEFVARRKAGWQPFFLDVRRPEEESIVSLPDTDLRVEHSEILSHLGEIPKDRDIVVYCRTGQRSMMVAFALKQSGFTGNVLNLAGGVHAWSDLVDSTVPKY
jgi:adenylyltransferase/sulfurtransferase